MGSFVAYQKLKTAALKRLAKESIEGITKWLQENPKRKTCHAELWYGIERNFSRKDNIAMIINDLLKQTLKKDAEDKSAFACPVR